MTKKMPAKVLDQFKAKPAPKKKGGQVPPPLAKYHQQHPNGKYAPKASKGTGKGK